MDDVKCVQEELLKIYKIFAEVCKKNNLKFYGCGGTALGAVRHSGFIPWDDDMDIAMPREDFNKLFSGKNQIELPDNVFLLEGGSMLFGRIENRSVFCDRGDEILNKKLPFLYVEIFPIDGTPNNSLMRNMHFLRVMVIFFFIKLKNMEEIQRMEQSKNRKSRPFLEKILIRYGHVFSSLFFWTNENKMVDKYKKLCQKYSFSNSEKVCVYSGRYRFKEIINKSVVGDGKRYAFHDTNILLYEEVETYLSQLYGESYNNIPPRTMWEKHGNIRIIT